MLYLANPTSSPEVHTAMTSGLLGLIDTPHQGSRSAVRRLRSEGVAWAADNGAFTDRWTAEHWWAWLTHPDQLQHASTALFATAPDVVADAWASHQRAMPWLSRIRQLGYPVAYVGQDGARSDRLPWGHFDVLFLGGTTEWKLGPTAAALTAEARGRGLHVHMGRVNSLLRHQYAEAIGCHSVDGTYITRAPDKLLPQLLSWADAHRPSPTRAILRARARATPDAALF